MEHKTERDLDLGVPSADECYEIVQNLKQGKAAGPDNICDEIIKNEGMEPKERIYVLILQIWNK